MKKFIYILKMGKDILHILKIYTVHGFWQLKKYTQPESRELFYLVGMFRTLESRRQYPSSSEKTALRRPEGKSGYIQKCNKGNRQPEYQRSGIRLRN